MSSLYTFNYWNTLTGPIRSSPNADKSLFSGFQMSRNQGLTTISLAQISRISSDWPYIPDIRSFMTRKIGKRYAEHFLLLIMSVRIISLDKSSPANECIVLHEDAWILFLEKILMKLLSGVKKCLTTLAKYYLSSITVRKLILDPLFDNTQN